jgi:hypothetical protein
MSESEPSSEDKEEVICQTEFASSRSDRVKRKVKNTHMLKCFDPSRKCECNGAGKEKKWK